MSTERPPRNMFEYNPQYELNDPVSIALKGGEDITVRKTDKLYYRAVNALAELEDPECRVLYANVTSSDVPFALATIRRYVVSKQGSEGVMLTHNESSKELMGQNLGRWVAQLEPHVTGSFLVVPWN